MTEEYSLKKKTNYWLNPWFIASLLFFIASLGFYYFLSQKPKLDLQQVDLNSRQLSEQVLADSFEIVVVLNDNRQIVSIAEKLFADRKAMQILTALSKNMIWPEAVMVENVLMLEPNRKNIAVINLQIDKSKAINLSIAQERDILNSIDQTLELNGISDFRILINGQESEIFLKNLSYKNRVN